MLLLLQAEENGKAAPAVAVAKKPTKAGGAYIPPFRLAQMMQEAESKTDATYQRLTWDALRKSINGLVNKANAINIRPILKELLSEVCNASRSTLPLFKPLWPFQAQSNCKVQLRVSQGFFCFLCG